MLVTLFEGGCALVGEDLDLGGAVRSAQVQFIDGLGLGRETEGAAVLDQFEGVVGLGAAEARVFGSDGQGQIGLLGQLIVAGQDRDEGEEDEEPSAPRHDHNLHEYPIALRIKGDTSVISKGMPTPKR